jgi:integrase
MKIPSTRRLRLTYKALERLKPGQAIPDTEVRGLRFIASHKGVYAQFRFKDAATGKWISMGLGRLPDENELDERIAADTSRHSTDADGVTAYSYTLEDAVDPFRKQASHLRRLANKGIDPRTETGPEGLPLELAIEKYEADMKQRGAVKSKDIISLLTRELLDPLGNVPVGTIKRPTVLKRIREIERSGRKGTARDFRTRVGVFLGWCANEGHVTANVLGGYKQPRRTRVQMHEAKRAGRALTNKEIPIVWRAAEAEGEPFGHYIRLMLLTGTRRQETALARWEHIDLRKGVWHIPEEITKNGAALDVPLPPLALSVLRELLPKGKPKGEVFRGRDGKTMSGFSRRMFRNTKKGPKGLRAETDKLGVAPWTPHDLRRTFRTGLAALHVDEAVAEKMLNHTVADELLAAYNRHDAWDERSEAAETWATHIETLLGAAAQSNVIHLEHANA